MTNQTKAMSREEVLFAFHRECTTPTLDQIVDWTKRHPEYAEEILDHAAIMRDWAAEDGPEEDEVDEVMLTRARSRALNAVFNAQNAQSLASDANENVTFDLLMSAAGTTTAQLSRLIDIGRDVLSDVFRGRMRRPIGPKLENSLLTTLRTTKEKLELALTYALANPSIGHAKATMRPTVIQRSYEEIIRSSEMSPERKSFWLDED
jgi:hypothetical protein